MRLVATARRLCILATVFVVGAMVVAAFFHNEFRSQNWDPMQTRVYVDRTIRYGGTFYENGLVNKGPLEPMVYRLAAAVTSWDGFWYAISALIIVVSGVLAWAASATVRTFAGGERSGAQRLGMATGVVVFFHFALGNADYAGVLYARNMVVGLFAGAWLIGLSSRWWFPRRAPWAALAVGVLIGLGIQTLFVSTVAALGVWLLAWSTIDGVDDERVYRRSRRILAVTPIAVFLSAPVYYVVRGRFAEFWDSYWVYNKYQNEATGRSLANQLVYGRDAILRYYRAWPVSFVIVVAFFAMTLLVWRASSKRERMIHIALTVWFVGAWTELVMSQRYSSHYFSVLALPTALMAATVIGHVYRLVMRERRARPLRGAVAWPLAAALLSIAAWGGLHVDLGLQAASAYDGVHGTAQGRVEKEPGQQRAVRAVLDLASGPGDPLLAWTEYPWTYLVYHRVAATRWIWKSFMLGQIYLARASADYVLPQTWEWFADDMREAKPAAFLEETALPVTPGNPFAVYVDQNFDLAYSDSTYNVYLRHDELDAIVDGDPGVIFRPVAALGDAGRWQIGNGRASIATDEPSVAGDLLRLAGTRCLRISGSYVATADATGSFLSFLFDGPAATTTARLNLAGADAFSGNEGSVFDSVTMDGFDPAGKHDFAIVVGDRSAALVIDGAIRAAVRLDQQTQLSLEVRSGGVTFSNLRLGDPPPDSGCP